MSDMISPIVNLLTTRLANATDAAQANPLWLIQTKRQKCVSSTSILVPDGVDFLQHILLVN